MATPGSSSKKAWTSRVVGTKTFELPKGRSCQESKNECIFCRPLRSLYGASMGIVLIQGTLRVSSGIAPWVRCRMRETVGKVLALQLMFWGGGGPPWSRTPVGPRVAGAAPMCPAGGCGFFLTKLDRPKVFSPSFLTSLTTTQASHPRYQTWLPLCA
jgi:hypothetical protein